MISEKALQEAIRTGVLSAAQADRLQAIEAGLADSRLEPQDEEKLRFISGFGDVFVTIGILLFLGAAGYFGSVFLGAPGAPLVAATASWLLAEFFTRRRRMALPSIVLLVGFCSGIFGTATQLMAPDAPMYGMESAAALMAGGALTALGAAVHYLRFRVPITIAAGVAALVAIFAGVLRSLGEGVYEAALHPVLFLSGILVFAAAMRFDMSDPLRQTRRTDIAFWLHLLAAPLIVHPILSRVWTDGQTISTQGALIILAVFGVLGAVAVLVNRRAILVSGLSYAGFAFGALIEKVGLSDNAVPLTLLALGAFVLLLSAGWAWLRTRMLSLVPLSLRARLPPDLAAPT